MENFEAKSQLHESIGMSAFTAGETVLDHLSIASKNQERVNRPAVAVRISEIPDAVRQFFHPYVLAFLALALTVGAYGYGNKLSKYSHHAGISKASPTHMWVDHRDESVVSEAEQQIKPTQIPGLALLAAALVPRVLRLSRDHIVVTPAPRRVASVISSHIPFRAPPSFHFSLA